MSLYSASKGFSIDISCARPSVHLRNTEDQLGHQPI